MKSLFFLSFWLFFALNTQAQELPKILDANSSDQQLEALSSEYKSSLLTAADTNLTKMVNTWKHCLTAMEFYADKINFDIKGVKMWVKIFWAKDGKIDHIAYYLQDNSINIPKVDFEAFLNSFSKNYQLPIGHKHRFSYASRVQFPMYLMYTPK